MIKFLWSVTYYYCCSHFLLFFIISLKFLIRLLSCPRAMTLCSMSLSFYCDSKRILIFYYNFCYFSLCDRMSPFNSAICCFRSLISLSFESIYFLKYVFRLVSCDCFSLLIRLIDSWSMICLSMFYCSLNYFSCFSSLVSSFSTFFSFVLS
jgi:hypothetical protein